jgi:hypothetical protein
MKRDTTMTTVLVVNECNNKEATNMNKQKISISLTICKHRVYKTHQIVSNNGWIVQTKLITSHD